jgi:hypothetical protein
MDGYATVNRTTELHYGRPAALASAQQQFL